MISTIKNILDLWDVFGLGVFPEDEYASYAPKIAEFLDTNTVSEDELTAFLYELLPPVNEPENEIEKEITVSSYRKCAMTLLEVVKQTKEK